MPVDTTRVISTRRTQKQISEEELKDIELKRLRGILSAGQGTRFILADTDQLHRKIADMSNRIRQLEDALAILQASVSDERHPLLSDEHLKMKFGSEALDPKKPQPEPSEEQKTKLAIDALGTLTLGESGEMKYFGRSAGSETLMMAEDHEEEDSEEEPGHDLYPNPIPLSPEVSRMESSVPLLSHREPSLNLLQHLDSFLPPREKATALCEVYLNHGVFFFRPVKREELYESLLPSVYQAALMRASQHDATANAGAAMDDNAPHAMATLLFIFALGALLDVQLAPYNGVAEHYYHLGKAALSLRPVCGSPSLETVSAVGLMATYHNLAGKKYSRDSAWSNQWIQWCIMSLAAKLAQSFGLPQRRLILFTQSLALGRPPAIHLSTSFTAVAEATLTAKAPSYETILDLDRRVREMSYQSASKPYASRADGQEIYHSSSLSLRDFYISQYRTVVMIYLHRSFFAQAVLDHPSNPLLSSFAPSFLTAYRCASVIIKASVHQFDRCASMAKRIWFLLYHTFSAAVIAGTIVTRSPNSTMAPNAMKDLDVAVQLFEQAAEQSHRAKVALTVLKRLQEKAHRCFKNVDKDHAPSADESSSPSVDSPTDSARSECAPAAPEPIQPKEEDDELAIFGGQIRVVTKKGKSRDSRSRTRSRTGSMSTESGTDSSPSPEANPSSLASTTRRPSVTIPEQNRPRRTPTLSPALSASFGFLPASPPPSSFFGSNHLAPQDGSLPPAGNPYPGFSTLLGTSVGPHSTRAEGTETGDYRAGANGSTEQSGSLHQARRSSINTATSPAMNADWMTGWDFGAGARARSAPSSSNPGSYGGIANNASTHGVASSSSNHPTGSALASLPGPSFFQDLDLDFPMGNPSRSTTSVQYGSDTATGNYPQSSQYDIQENAALLGNSDHDMGGPGARTPTPYLMNHPPNGSSPGSRPDVAATAAFLNSIARNGGHPTLGSMRGMSQGPGARGAAYGGRDPFGGANMNPGESRLDAGWIAFMRDCGIFGMDRTPQSQP
ncbi:hypothetical protein BKA70DRAFT_1236790 [Coprinopsis sp. MPI-PUGE-AT-0042]|nr:hypothetical protein BKA70DRAFT_1236790 [Coprinopsis sp. MPI-PUGE-AT-0042]